MNIDRLLLLALVAGALLPSTARAVEVGECALVGKRAGMYTNDACTKEGHGGFAWRALSAETGYYRDGHPEVIDEPQSFDGEGVDLRCRRNDTWGHVTGPDTSSQYQEDDFCKLDGRECANVEPQPEEGTYVEDGELVREQFELRASFECGGEPATLEGPYEGTVVIRKGRPDFNEQFQVYDLKVGSSYGAQALTLTIGLQSFAVTLTGEQEDNFVHSRRVVFRP